MNRPASERISESAFAIGVVLAASLALAVADISLTAEAQPDLRCGSAAAMPGVWSPEWDTAPAISVKCPYPGLKWMRLVTVRALRAPSGVAVLFEWPDSTEDMSFEGAYYPQAVSSPVPMAQESVLLRDELTVWLGDGTTADPQLSVLRGKGINGSWHWRSQWQHEKERSPLVEVRKVYGASQLDIDPLPGFASFAARQAGNSNAILADATSCKWIVRPVADPLAPPVSRRIGGDGRWRDGSWRVVFRVPAEEVARIGHRLALSVSLADGGLGERMGEEAHAQPVWLNLNGWKGGD